MTYSEMSPELGIPVEEIKRIFSKNAFVFKSRKLDTFVISYDNCLSDIDRQFYLLHEFGHILNGHLAKYRQKSKSELLNEDYIADNFALSVLKSDKPFNSA